MEDPPTVSTEGEGNHNHRSGRIDDDDANLSKPRSASPRRRSRFLTAAIVGLILIVGVIVVLSLSLTGAFHRSASSAPPAASSSSSSQASSSNGTSGDASKSPQNGASPTPVNTTDDSSTTGQDSNSSGTSGASNSTSTSSDGSSSSNSTTPPDGGSAPGGDEERAIDFGAPYPTDPHESVDIWSGDAANATSLQLSGGELVRVRWPECVGLDASPECETLIRSTNPYVNDVYVLGPFDYTTEEFRNDRVSIFTDEGGILVAQVPTIG